MVHLTFSWYKFKTEDFYRSRPGLVRKKLYHKNLRWTWKDVLIWKGSSMNMHATCFTRERERDRQRKKLHLDKEAFTKRETKRFVQNLSEMLDWRERDFHLDVEAFDWGERRCISCNSLWTALPAGIKVESGTSQSRSGTSVDLSYSGNRSTTVKLTNTEPFAAWFVVSGDATADGIRVVRSVLGAISCHQLPSHQPVATLIPQKGFINSFSYHYSYKEYHY